MYKFIFGIFLFTFFSVASADGEPAVWSVNSRAEVLKGDARGVSIGAEGAISLAPRFTEIFTTDQPYIWSSVIGSGGSVYLGTGGEGRIFKVSPSGAGNLLADLPELNVTALAIGRSGELFAASSPDGKVYKIDASGKAEVYFDPKEKYIWSLVVMSDGSLAVGTGGNGKIFRVAAAGAAPEASLLFDTGAAHITSLSADRQGNLYAGTDASGIVLKFGADKKPFALLDSPLREMKAISLAPDGSIYALALGESASAAPATENKTAAAERQNASAPEPAPKSRYDLTGAKSAVYRIMPDGGTDIIWSSATVTGFSLSARPGGGVLIGTSDKGRIYQVANDGSETLLIQSDAGQISTFAEGGDRLYATTSNQGRLMLLGPATSAEGIYESAVLDAKSSAAWGRIWWNAAGSVQIQTRSGNTEKSDETWSRWTAADAANGQITSPKSRFLQWRAILKPGTPQAVLNETSIAYLPQNIAPEVLSIQILPTNIGLLPTLPIQIDPNIELSGLDPSLFGIPAVTPAPRRAYQRGARALQWTAEDRNGDRLTYDIYYKEIGDAGYKPLREGVTETFLTIDGLTLADGRYTVRIVAMDSRSNPADQALSGERSSEPFDIDNTAPVVTAVSKSSRTAVFAAADKASYIRSAEYSINGKEWQAVYADDGITDSPAERFTIRMPETAADEIAVTLRVFDSNGNAGNARIIITR